MAISLIFSPLYDPPPPNALVHRFFGVSRRGDQKPLMLHLLPPDAATSTSRELVQALQTDVRQCVGRTAYWLEHCANASLVELLDLVADLDVISCLESSGLVGGGLATGPSTTTTTTAGTRPPGLAAHMDTVAMAERRPGKFLCLLQRALQIGIPVHALEELLLQPYLVTLRVFAMVYFRLVCRNAATVHNVLWNMCQDYRAVVLLAPRPNAVAEHEDGRGALPKGNRATVVSSVDAIADTLASEHTFLGLVMPTLPSRVNTHLVSEARRF